MKSQAFLAVRLAVAIIPLLGAAPAPELSAKGSLDVHASLKNRKLPQQTEGETFLRIAVTGERLRTERRGPMNVALVIDRSGSMAGVGPKGTNKMEDAKKAALALLDQLGEADHFSVISFDNGAELLGGGPAIPARLTEARARVSSLSSRGGTDMIAGLSQGIAQAKEHYRQDRTNRVLLISDGVPNSEQGLVEMARAATQKGVQVTTIGVGTDYNENLMSRIADAGAGNYHFIGDATALAAVLQKELKELMAVVGREAFLKVQFASGVTPVKFFGYDVRTVGDETIVPLGDLFSGQTAEVLVKVRHGKLEGERKVAKVSLAYYDAVRKSDRRAEREVAAAFVADGKAVTASLDKDTAAKAEKVAAAQVIEEASERLRAGRRDEALSMVRAQNALNLAAQSSIGASAAGTGGDVLMSFEAQMAKPAAAPSEAVIKEAKMQARGLSR